MAEAEHELRVLEIPWVEKYRPKRLDDIVDQEHVVRRLKAYVESGNLPNLLFAGPPGTGKTTAALCLAREMFGEHWRDNFLELNASDERGIDVIRTKVKNFARTRPIGGAPFKIIFLDEADNLTRDSQQALRRIMEMYSDTCRFILAANYSSAIIDPIQSRCVVFKFKKLPEEAIKERLREIAEQEGIEVTDEALDAIVYVSEGDMRKAVNVLQAAAALGKVIDRDTVYEIASTARPEHVKEVIRKALEGDFMAARSRLHDIIARYGMSGEDVVRQMHRVIFEEDLGVPDEVIPELVDAIGEAEYRMVRGSDERIQLEALLARISSIGAEAGS